MQYSSFFILQFLRTRFSYFDVPGSLFSATSLGDVGFSGCQAELSFLVDPVGSKCRTIPGGSCVLSRCLSLMVLEIWWLVSVHRSMSTNNHVVGEYVILIIHMNYVDILWCYMKIFYHVMSHYFVHYILNTHVYHSRFHIRVQYINLYWWTKRQLVCCTWTGIFPLPCLTWLQPSFRQGKGLLNFNSAIEEVSHQRQQSRAPRRSLHDKFVGRSRLHDMSVLHRTALHCLGSFFLKLHDAVRKQQLHPPLVLALRDLPLVVRSCREVVEVVSRRNLTAKPKQGGQGQEWWCREDIGWTKNVKESE